MFGSMVGFSRSADRMALFRFHQIQDGSWPPSSKISNGHIVLDPRVGFSGTADRMALFPVSLNPSRHLGKFQMAISLQRIIGSTSCLILGRVFGDGRSNGPTSSCTKSKIRQPAILENFE